MQVEMCDSTYRHIVENLIFSVEVSGAGLGCSQPGAKFKGLPKTSVIEINNIFMLYI